jgi:hypothetical protein
MTAEAPKSYWPVCQVRPPSQLRERTFLTEAGDELRVSLDFPGHPFVSDLYVAETTVYLYVPSTGAEADNELHGAYFAARLDKADGVAGYYHEHECDGRLFLENFQRTHKAWISSDTVKAIVVWAKAGGTLLAVPPSNPRGRRSALAV